MVLAEGENRINWQFFVESFQRQYLGEAQLSGKVQEFMYLKQGKMTVTEYVAKFNELARFALFIVPTNEARKKKFMLGLKVDVAKQIDSGRHGPETYADAIQRALRNESWDRHVPQPPDLLPQCRDLLIPPLDAALQLPDQVVPAAQQLQLAHALVRTLATCLRRAPRRERAR